MKLVSDIKFSQSCRGEVSPTSDNIRRTKLRYISPQLLILFNCWGNIETIMLDIKTQACYCRDPNFRNISLVKQLFYWQRNNFRVTLSVRVTILSSIKCFCIPKIKFPVDVDEHI